MDNFRHNFIQFALEKQVLKFGQFVTKAGRKSPYFFNAGLFNDGSSLLSLSRYYATAILHSDVEFDMLFGPAYKGIILASSCSMALAEQNRNVPFAYNRKEAKDHGEGGVLVGAPLRGKVLIIDDVITAGTSVRESIELIRTAGAEPAGVVIALDRMERGQGALSAVQEVEQIHQLPVIAIATLNDIMTYLSDNPEFISSFEAIKDYRTRYGVEQ